MDLNAGKLRASPAFMAIGANRNPAAADWDVASGLLAFGAGDAVAVWDPAVRW